MFCKSIGDSGQNLFLLAMTHEALRLKPYWQQCRESAVIRQIRGFCNTVLDQPDRPQPARDSWLQSGMATVIGRLRPCPVLGIKMVILGHNTVRGAAGAAILNAETMVRQGYLKNGEGVPKGRSRSGVPISVQAS